MSTDMRSIARAFLGFGSYSFPACLSRTVPWLQLPWPIAVLNRNTTNHPVEIPLRQDGRRKISTSPEDFRTNQPRCCSVSAFVAEARLVFCGARQTFRGGDNAGDLFFNGTARHSRRLDMDGKRERHISRRRSACLFHQHYFQDESEANMAPTGRTALQAHFSIIRTWICRDATFT